jgi:hypothetical protein
VSSESTTPRGRSRAARLWRALEQIDGFMEGASIFGESDDDRAYFVNGTQVASADGNQFELRLTRRVISEHRQALKQEPSVVLRRSGSDWIVVEVTRDEDEALVLRLATLAAAAHRPATGILKEPPTGAELARRRRFH